MVLVMVVGSDSHRMDSSRSMEVGDMEASLSMDSSRLMVDIRSRGVIRLSRGMDLRVVDMGVGTEVVISSNSSRDLQNLVVWVRLEVRHWVLVVG